MPSSNLSPSGKPVTLIGVFSRIPTPPSLSLAVTGIGVISSRLVTVAPSAEIVGPILSRGVTSNEKITGLALFTSSVALNIIVFCLPTSSATVLIVTSISFTLSSFVINLKSTGPACPDLYLVRYLVKNSFASNETFLSSVAFTLNVTVSPSTTVT